MTAGISGFFLPRLKNPLASKNKVNTGLEAPWRHSYYAPPSQDTPDSLESQEESLEESSEESEEGSGSKETKDVTVETSKEESDKETNEESDEYSLYSDIADQEYDYEEEDYEGTEDDDDVMPRNLPTDPIGLVGRFISDIGRRLEIEIGILSRNIRIGLALLTFTG